jgi:hypothetical protein
LVGGLLSTGPSDGYRSLSIRDVAEVALACLGGALLPLALHAFELSQPVTWRVASAAFSVLWVIGFLIGMQRFLRSGVARQAPAFLAFGPFAAAVGNALLWWNVLSASPAAGRYVAALMLYLTVAGLSFLAAVFHGRGEPAV